MFIFSNHNKFVTLWNEYLNRHNGSWRYLLKWRDYQNILYSDAIISDLSFIYLDNRQAVAICPLFIENQNKTKQISLFNSYQVAPLVDINLGCRHRKKIEKLCFTKIDELSKEYSVKKTMLLLDPLAEEYKYNVLSEYSYIDSSSSTSIIDLSLDIKNLWSQLRKSYKSLINNGKDSYTVIVMDSTNPDYAMHENYRRLHHKTAGRVTRPKETFDLQFEMLKDDNAILIGLQNEDKYVGFSYFFHHNKKAFYASSSDDPEYTSDVPIEHYIIWTAIEYYKKRNLRLLELGLQQFSSQVFDHPSKKDINISFFKRGFGGKIFSSYRGIKYYDREYMKKDLEDTKKRLINSTLTLEHS